MMYNEIVIMYLEGNMPTNDASKENKTNHFPNFKMPNVDMKEIMGSYKKNLEILGLINKMSMEVYSGIAKLQSTFIKQMMSDLGSVAEKGAKPAEALAKFSDVMRDNIVNAINNGKQISDMITTTNNELTAVVANRVKESIDSIKQHSK